MNETSPGRHTLARLPQFSAIDPAAVATGVKALVDDHRQRVKHITDNPADASWAAVVTPMEQMADELQRLFAPLSHLHNVADSDALRAAYNESISLLSAWGSELAQNAGLFRCYQALRDGPGFAALEHAEQKLIDNALRDFRLGGVDLPADKQEVVSQLRVALSTLTTRFEENLLDATEAFRLPIKDPAALSGLPPAVLALVRQNATPDDGAEFVLTLDLPCYLPAMQYLEDRELRRSLYTAYVTRASDQGAPEQDNSNVMAEILEHRQALATTLGFDHYADLSLATKMAPSSAAVFDFLGTLATRARPAAERELADLQAFARAELNLPELEAWDIPFSTERLRKAHYNISQEDLRPYFPVAQVQQGLFRVVETLFDVVIEACPRAVDTWHEAVQFFAVCARDGDPIGFFYLDLYARQGKRSGAWMDECLVRWASDDGLQLPVAYLTCNFTPPVGASPSLLTHDEVTTLFHEFGHGLHHMLTRIGRPAVAGINGVPWDAVELPSQILENWCWEREALALISAHHETGAAIPDELYERLHATRNFQAAMQTLRQVEFALFDFRLHKQYQPGCDIQALLDEIRAEVAVVVPPAFNRFQHSFSHIFAGGYAAGYYSYKWAEVLAADAYARFEDDGVFNRATGREFREAILEQGGAEDAMTLFRRFRGREPSVDPLLRQAGLIE